MNENNEYITHPEEMGSILISEEVLSAIAASAASEIEGVAGLMGASAGKKGSGRGEKITLDGDGAVVDVYLMVNYGQPIPEVAEKVQSAVVSSMEAMAGFSVAEVNVHVGGVSFA